MTERERYSVVLHLIALWGGLLVGCGWIYSAINSTQFTNYPSGEKYIPAIASVTGTLCVALPIVITITLGCTLFVLLISSIKKALTGLAK